MTNAFPDNPAVVAYSAPLYKANPKTRGKVSIHRGPNGRYKFIAAGPDHRRAESSGSDGIVRGSYSYLDDNGMQRTVEYIAGAGIGYRIVQNSIGPGTHLNPSVSDFRLNDPNFKLASDFGSSVSSLGEESSDTEYLQTAGSGRLRPKDNDRNKEDRDNIEGETPKVESRNNAKFDRADSDSSQNHDSPKPTKDRGGIRFKGASTSLDQNDFSRNEGKSKETKNSLNRSSSKDDINKLDTSRSRATSSSSDNYSFRDDEFASIPPLISGNRKILQIDRDRDWVERNRDSTIIKNVGNWYIGLTPGQSVRAHVQNIDLLPLGGRRIPSPSEALRQDEIAAIASS